MGFAANTGTDAMLLKWAALGVWQHSGAYFRDGWNVLDGFLVLISLVSGGLALVT